MAVLVVVVVVIIVLDEKARNLYGPSRKREEERLNAKASSSDFMV
jgi:tetrahydromethanopterin S-methyltransferase subunit E